MDVYCRLGRPLLSLSVTATGQDCGHTAQRKTTPLPHWPDLRGLHWQWDAGGHAEVPLGHCRGNWFLGSTRSTPSLLLVFFGKCRGLRFFPRFPLLLVLNFTGVISSQEIILWNEQKISFKPTRPFTPDTSVHKKVVRSWRVSIRFKTRGKLTFLPQSNEERGCS